MSQGGATSLIDVPSMTVPDDDAPDKYAPLEGAGTEEYPAADDGNKENGAKEEAEEEAPVSAKERAKWLSEKAFSGGDKSNGGTPKRSMPRQLSGIGDAGSGNARDRAKWLQESAFKKGGDEPKKSTTTTTNTGGGGTSAKERAKWLQEQAFKGNDDENKNKNVGSSGGGGGGTTAKERAKWLQERAFKDADEANKKRADAMRNKSWMELEGSTAGGGAKERAKWLQEEAFRKEEENGHSANGNEKKDVVSEVSAAADAAREAMAVALEPTFSEATGAASETEKEGVVSEASDAAADADEPPSAAAAAAVAATPPRKSELVSEKMKWLQEQGKGSQHSTPNRVDAASELRASGIGSSSTKDRAKWLQEEAALRPGSAKKDKEGKPISPASEACQNSAAKAKWRHEQEAEWASTPDNTTPSKRPVEIQSSSNVSERMKWLSGKVDNYQKGVTRESDVVEAKSGKLKFVAALASNARDAPDKFKAVPHEVKIENVEATIRDGLIPAVKTQFANGNLYVVRDVCALMKELIPFRFIRKHPEPVAELVDALLEVDPSPEALKKAGTSKAEVLARTALAVAPLLAIVGREDENLPVVAPRYLRLVDYNLSEASLWKEVVDMASRDPESLAERNEVACRAVRERESVPQWEQALAVLDKTSRFNVEPVEDIADSLAALCSSGRVRVTALTGTLMAYAEKRPEILKPFLRHCAEELDDEGGCAAVMPLFASASSCGALFVELMHVVDAIENDTDKFGAPSYISDSSTIVKEVLGVGVGEDDQRRCLRALLALAGAQKAHGSFESDAPLSYFKEVYQTEEVPRDVIDGGMRPEVEWYRDECTDESMRAIAADILDYRDDSSVIVKELTEGQPSLEDVKAGLTTLLDLARAQEGREGGSATTPLIHFNEVYQMEGIPRDIVDDMRPKLVNYRDKSPDESTRKIATEILDYRDDSSVIVKELSEGRPSVDEVEAGLTLLLALAAAQEAREEGGSATTPLRHFQEVYQMEDVPRNIIDGEMRPKIEWYRDECADESARKVAAEILDYRDDSSVVVRELREGGRQPSVEEVEAGLTTLLELAAAKEAREGGSAATPLAHFGEVYRTEDVPRDVIDGEMRPQIERYRDESADESTRKIAAEILDYRDDSSVIVKELSGAQRSDEEVNTGLMVLLELAEAQEAREGGSPTAALSHFKEVCEMDGVSYGIVDAAMRSRIEKLGDESSDDAARAAAKDVLRHLNEAELRDVKAFVEQHEEEIKKHIGSVASKLPMPVMFSSKDKDAGSRKKMSLYFECCDKVEGCLYPGRAPKKAFVSESTEINKWLQVAVAAVLVDVSIGDQNDLKGVGAVKKAWESAQDAYDGSFKDFVSQSFLDDAEQETLVEQLKGIDFYDQFKYWAPKGGWRCAVCHQKEVIEKKKIERSVPPPLDIPPPQSAPATEESRAKSDSSEGVLVMGMIERRSGGMAKKWKKQLVKVLFSEQAKQIVYDDPQNPKKHGVIELRDVEAVAKEKRGTYKQEYVFSVTTAKKTYYFATRHVNDIDTWVSVISGCLERIGG